MLNQTRNSPERIFKLKPGKVILFHVRHAFINILLTKFSYVAPPSDVLIVGKSVCRKAQELLLRANIVLCQYTKATLMSRIARQTGAKVLSSIDHVMNSTVLGE